MTRSLLRGALFGAICAAIVGLLSLLDPTLFGSEWLLRDAFTRPIAAKRKPDPRIVLVTASEESLKVLAQLNWGRPPYPRSIYAMVIAELRRAGASVIAFDILFPEEDQAHPDADREFASALGTAPTILAADTQPGVRTSSSAAAGRPRPADSIEKAPDETSGARGRDVRTPTSPFAAKLWQVRGLARQSYTATTPLAQFQQCAGIGTIRMVTSPRSANVHAYPTADRVEGDTALPSLAFEAVRLFRHFQPAAVRRDGRFEFGNLRIPLDSRGDMIIRWNGSKVRNDTYDPGMISYQHYDLHQVVIAAMAHDDPSLLESVGTTAEKLATFESAFRGKIVFVGYTAAGLLDLRPNPLSAVAPGLELHANAADNLLNGQFAEEAPRGLVLPLILGAAALLGMLIYPMRSQIASATIAVLTIAAALLIGYAALASGVVVPNVAAAASLALTYVSITVSRFIAEQEQTAMLRTTFGRYVSPQILDHILAHPERVHLGGERRDLTILFSDIRGFTSISEASEPEQVVDMLNEYLTRMVEILLAHGGTLDKFIGDAVMGFWNAPAADPDHPRHAVACAIEMVQETARIREKWMAQGRPSLRIGVGINTGEAVVGNIGAEKVFGYTVIGDAVNLASRLEGKNKDYVTEIIISEFTKERIGEQFDLVYLDEVKVKGKEKAVKIFQVKA